ncbi:alpha-galactosidase [Chitinophaga sp. SYP-B3965]|uniref:alpha-galactosidase n=1 Tax=Chitinophaga sp. SYP-B3965 TaxID=2663120 RepID=UPI001299B673|nr:alpha-galactosidase [Chitinophaga sp. SYP-B3965]MRG47155.1 alpha-galactosidase [Chitinophaga sp. SYP-B3965]
MKRKLLIIVLSMFYPAVQLFAQQQIAIETDRLQWLLQVNEKGKLYQSYLGEKLLTPAEVKAGRHEAFVGAGMNDLFEPAIRVTHKDGNPSLDLVFASVQTKKEDANTSTTIITLKDPQYAIEVKLFITAYSRENIFSSYTEIIHNEKGTVTLHNYASAMLHFDAPHYWLTQFHGDWAEEMKMQETELTSGIKILDSKLGSRAHMYQPPFFFLSLNQPAGENNGEVLAGTLAWSGNFRFAFEVDEQNSLRMIAGMNNYAADYPLAAGKPFVTPAFIFTYSNTGKGTASRSFHSWAGKYGVMDADSSRMVLLNNWESTGFDFNEQKLTALFADTRKLGADLFLLDDGWFANKYPRNSDHAGLGDWEENKAKLPHGIGHLVKEATANQVKFGIWLEPEMVNPKSKLYEDHPDWVLKLPNREENYFRNQLVLDLVNPAVQDFVYDIVDKLLTKNPGIAYIKWDCNRMMTNAWSPYLKDQQSSLSIAYTQSLYKILQKLRVKYPHLPMMLCSGGGGRVDYGALRYFTEFWPSDNTDGLERVFMQWGYSYFFPSFTISSHVTSWGKQSLKFRTDVAMMGRLGYDIDVNKFTEEEWHFSQEAIKNYNRLKNVISHGEMYRLISPYEEQRAVLMYVNNSKTKAVLFAYNLHTHYGEQFQKVRLSGLDPQKRYKVKEINLEKEAQATEYSGDYLMKVGLSVSSNKELSSKVLEIQSL